MLEGLVPAGVTFGFLLGGTGGIAWFLRGRKKANRAPAKTGFAMTAEERDLMEAGSGGAIVLEDGRIRAGDAFFSDPAHARALTRLVAKNRLKRDGNAYTPTFRGNRRK